MTIRTFALAASALALIAPQAFAQTPAAPAAAAAQLPPPPGIPGICVFSQEQAVGSSVVGKYVSQRLQQIDAQSNAELNTQKTALETEARALEGQRQALGEQAFGVKAQELNTKANTFQQLVNTRVREGELTEAKALQRIGQDMTPLMVEVFRARSCSLLIDRNSVFFTAPSMDITADVVTKLDAKLTQFPFERERADQQPQAAAGPAAPAAGAARPATTPATPARR